MIKKYWCCAYMCIVLSFCLFLIIYHFYACIISFVTMCKNMCVNIKRTYVRDRSNYPFAKVEEWPAAKDQQYLVTLWWAGEGERKSWEEERIHKAKQQRLFLQETQLDLNSEKKSYSLYSFFLVLWHISYQNEILTFANQFDKH